MAPQEANLLRVESRSFGCTLPVQRFQKLCLNLYPATNIPPRPMSPLSHLVQYSTNNFSVLQLISESMPCANTLCIETLCLFALQQPGRHQESPERRHGREGDKAHHKYTGSGEQLSWNPVAQQSATPAGSTLASIQEDQIFSLPQHIIPGRTTKAIYN